MESNKYLTGKWLNGRKIMVVVSTSLIIATVIKITDLTTAANNGSASVERGKNVSTDSGVECIVGEDGYYTSQARRVKANFNSETNFS